jgi:uncharacterized protein YceK
MRMLLIILIVIISGCVSIVPKSAIYRGEYFYNFESAYFTPEGSSESWCVNSAKLKDAELPTEKTSEDTWGTAQVVVRGLLSRQGKYCNLGAYKHFLEITEIIDISNRKRRTP